MLYRLRCRQQVAGVKDHFIDAEDQVEADWRGRAVCDEKMWVFISCAPAVIADGKTHPMPKADAAKKTARVGA